MLQRMLVHSTNVMLLVVLGVCKQSTHDARAGRRGGAACICCLSPVDIVCGRGHYAVRMQDRSAVSGARARGWGARRNAAQGNAVRGNAARGNEPGSMTGDTGPLLTGSSWSNPPAPACVRSAGADRMDVSCIDAAALLRSRWPHWCAACVARAPRDVNWPLQPF